MRFSFAVGLFWLSVACCAVAQLLILRSVRATSQSAPASPLPRSSSRLELLWALVPAVGLALLLTFTWRAVQETARPSAAAPAAAQGPR